MIGAASNPAAAMVAVMHAYAVMMTVMAATMMPVMCFPAVMAATMVFATTVVFASAMPMSAIADLDHQRIRNRAHRIGPNRSC
ncbi:hypothetical protein [Pseudorhodoplanes sp.]|uniref:hypothetical protein n=1 Tax=Pseudorhodoplanes sp. TaxID=1934341 RepID=UPI002C0ED095|nr:hypothetical protein [Pseudorhodoplanes sp.]HWV51916.1 hypothetical protein [Pseudorhodoplanes sp.]